MVSDEPIGSRASDGVADLTLISNIDDGGINENLRVRYENQSIYTYAGSILIAVNPYEELEIYEAEYQALYCGQRLGDLAPHVFAIAESAYRKLCTDDADQAIVISGESGAGKTESTKFILQYLCSVTSSQSSWVEHQILEANTILEAFGNAKTARNDNSSRFGKFIQVCFDERGQIGGCVVRDYLLERSRIALQSSSERNYHVFYQLVAAARRDPELAKRLQLEDCAKQEFTYLNQSGCTSIEGVDDASNFDSLRLAMSVLRVPETMSEGIFAALSAILWLGNLEFEEQAESERCRLTDNDELIISTVATLLGVDAYRLTLTTLRRQISVRGTVTDIPLSLREARENRHAMSMALYSRTFAWLVKHVNACTLPDQAAKRFIGVLDIFGFENFALNSFEQLCINYANEKLQRFFNHYVFALEQQIYQDEGISFEHIAFTDNTPCVELLEKPPKCILRLLSEECRIPRGTDSTFLQKLHTEFGSGSSGGQTPSGGSSNSLHPYYVKGDDCRRWTEEFGVRHYAGEVMYQVADFLAKNKDVGQEQLFEIMHDSGNDFVRAIAGLQDTAESIYGTIGRTGADGTLKGSKGRPLVADAFRQQLSALVDLLSATRPWYVRCIKPNLHKRPRNYDEGQVRLQLKYLGMLDIIRIRREGFPAHFTFAVFIARFRCLLVVLSRSAARGLKPSSISAKDLLNRLKIDPLQWQIGHSKVFLKALVADELEERRSAIRDRAAVRLQATWRRLLARRHYLLLKSSAIIIQRSFRATRARLLYQRQRRAAITIQAFVRGMFAREVARALRNMRKLEAERAIRRQPTVEEEEDEEDEENGREVERICDNGDGQVNGTLPLSYSKRTSTPDELDVLERQLQNDVQQLCIGQQSLPLPPPPPPPPPSQNSSALSDSSSANYEEIDHFPAKQPERDHGAMPADRNNNNLNEEAPAVGNGGGSGAAAEELAAVIARRKSSTGGSISAQFEQLIAKAELAATSLEAIQVASSPRARAAAASSKSKSKSGLASKTRNSTTSLADQLKAIINVEDSGTGTGADSAATSGIDTGNSQSPSIYSMDSAVSEDGAASENGQTSSSSSSSSVAASEGAGTSASDTLMLAAINEDAPNDGTGGKGGAGTSESDRSSIASSSILDNRTTASTTSDTTSTTGTREDCMSIMSGATGTSGEFEAVSTASPVSYGQPNGTAMATSQLQLQQQQQQQQQQLAMAQMAQQQQMIYGVRGGVPAQQQQPTYMTNSASQLAQLAAQLGGNYQIINNQLVPIAPQQQSMVVQQQPPPPQPSKFISKQLEAHTAHHNNGGATSDSLNGPLDGPLPEKNFELVEYVARYCNSHPRDAYGSNVQLGGASGSAAASGVAGKDRTLTRKTRKGVNEGGNNNTANNSPEAHLTAAEMITWTSAATIPTSHVHLHDPQNVVLACAIFKELVKYTAGEKKPDAEVRFIQTVIGHGIEREELRDEIFLQAVRLSNDGPSREHSLRCWSLLALATAAFPPGKPLSRYLLTYLRRHLRAHTSIACYAQFCLDNLQHGRISPRRYPPSVAEVKAVTALRSLVCRFHLLDGRTKAIDLHPADTAADAVLSLATKLGLQNVDGWAIFEVTPDAGERVLRAHDYVADVLTIWEMRARAEANSSSSSKNSSSNGSSSSTSASSDGATAAAVAAASSSQCRFVFKKRLFRPVPKEALIPQDQVEIGLLYAQAVYSVVRLDEFPVSERIALQLAGLQAQVSLGDFIHGRIRSYEDVENYISARVRRSAGHSSMEWAVKIADAHRMYGTGKTQLMAKVWYLSLVIQYPLYGAALFPAQYKGFLAVFGAGSGGHSQPLLLGIHSACVFVVAAADKRVLATYRYADIEAVTIYPAENLLTIQLFNKADGTGQSTTGSDGSKCLTFETSAKEEIASLIAAYSPSHASAWNMANGGAGNGNGWNGGNGANGNGHGQDVMATPLSQRGPRRLLKMTLEDRLRLHHEVINARRALANANIMRKPEMETANSSGWKSTLRRFGRGSSKTNKKGDASMSTFDDDYSSDEVLKNYPRAFWAYVKEPLTSSLLVISDPDLEGAAVTMFEQILSYSGLRSLAILNLQQQQQQNRLALNGGCSDGSGSDQEEWCMKRHSATHSEQAQIRAAQAILEKCIASDADILRNEFFLQLVRQTTDHPEPNSRVNIRHWQLLTLACSLTQPSDRRVLAYLMAHLRRISLDQVTREGQYAQFALRNLQGTLETRGRRLAPSRPEIAATIQCRRVYAKVHFLNGNHQAVEFDACAVIAEVLDQIQLKIELRKGCPGYALYQSLGATGGEQALQPEDKVGDAIAFWEKWHDERVAKGGGGVYGTVGGGPGQEPVHSFIFKKHLQIDAFIDLNDPVERELLYHQTLYNVRNDRFPLTDQEAILLVAIRAQIEYGDSEHPNVGGGTPSSNDRSSTASLDDSAYVYLLSTTLPERLTVRISVAELRSQHQAQSGLDANQAKMAFFNLIQSWPLHRATVFEVLQTYTSSWPKTLWLAIDQSGMHLLQPRSRNVLCSTEYRNLIDYTATSNSLMIVANTPTTVAKAMKYIFITHQALQIAQLLRDYTSKVVNANNPNRMNNHHGLGTGGPNGGGSPAGINGGGGAGSAGGSPAVGGGKVGSRRKSVEFDLALRNTTTTERINKPSPYPMMLGNGGGGGGGGNGMLNSIGGPIPQPRRSLMSAATTYDTQFYMQHTAAQAVAAAAVQQAATSGQLYQNHAQLQYQILQQQFAAQQLHNLQLAQAQQQQAQAQAQQQQQQLLQGQQLAAVQQAQAAAAANSGQRRPRPLVRHTDADHV